LSFPRQPGERGGPDNITVLIVRIREQPASANAEPDVCLPWYRRIPWPVLALIGGVVMLGCAAALTRFNQSSAGILVFLLAALAIVTGLGGLFVFYDKERRRLAVEPDQRRLRIYRKASCEIDRPLVDKMSRALQALELQIREKQWGTDWNGFIPHRDTAEKLLAEGNLTDSFREFCGAMHCLAEQVQAQRPRGEQFQPVWDRG
jgi:hypothetical protein